MSDQVKYNKLANKRVLVIGGTSGIGYTTAEATLEQGAHVIISSSNESRISATVSKLQSLYPSKSKHVTGHACNLADSSTVDDNIVALLKAATSNGSQKLDHVVWTAADPLAVIPLKDLDMAKIHKAGQVRFFAPLLLGKHAKEFLNDAHTSSITLTTGAVSQRPIPDWTLIGAYATGLHGLTRGLALDLAPIRVNCVSPGFVDTELWKGMPEDQKQGLVKSVVAGSTTGEIGHPEDVTEAYLYVMRDNNCSGSLISTNSGHLLK